jgi:hypothetical protein
MAYFGSDGNNNVAGINPPALPEGSMTPWRTYENHLYLVGGQVSEAGTPTHVSLYVHSYDNVTASNHYVAVYKGGTASDPTGATLIGVSANITSNFGQDDLDWETFALTGTAAFSASDYLWVAVIGRGATTGDFGMRLNLVDPDSSALTYRENWTNKGVDTYDYIWDVTDGTSGGPSSAVPSGGAWTASQPPIAAYITYTVGGGAITGRSLLLGIG